jgi:hypothetical protein
MDCLHQVSAIVILDAEGRRLFAKYYPEVTSGGAGRWPTVDSQMSFERALHSKTRLNFQGTSADNNETVIIYEGVTIVYALEAEIGVYIVGPGDENELVLCSVLTCLTETLQQLLKTTQPIDKRSLLEAYEMLLLVVDEIIDDGIIFETSSANVVQEVQPYVVPDSQAADGAKKAFQTFNRFLKQNV